MRRLAYGLGLLPAAAGQLVGLAVSGPPGGVDTARRHLACGGVTSALDDRASGVRVLLHGVLGTVLGGLFWWLVWLALLATARGPFYGFVDPGPYDHAWGGPNIVGAWAAHAWVWVGALMVLALVWWALGALHIRLTEHVLGGRRRVWTVLVTVPVVLGFGLLVVTWVQQF